MAKAILEYGDDLVVCMALRALRSSWEEVEDKDIEEFPNIVANKKFIIDQCNEILDKIQAQIKI